MNLNSDSKIQNLLEELKNGSETNRRAAAYKLGKLDHPSSIPGLTEALSDTDAIVRLNAATALREIEAQTALGEKAASTTPPPSIGERSLAALSHILFIFYLATPLLDYLERALAEIVAYVVLITPPLFGLITAFALKRRSPFTASHALQAAVAHPIFPIIAIILVYMTNSETNTYSSEVTLLAMCLLPVYFLWPLLILIGTAQAASGKDFTYPLIGKEIKNIFLSYNK